MRVARWAAAAMLGVSLSSACSDKKDHTASPTTASAETVTTQPRRITGGPFCEFSLTFNDRFGRMGADFSNPDRLRPTFEQAAKAIEDAEPLAPPELRSDVRVLATTFRTLVGVFERANYDFTRLPPGDLQRLSSPEVQAAGQRLDAYIRENCRTA